MESTAGDGHGAAEVNEKEEREGAGTADGLVVRDFLGSNIIVEETEKERERERVVGFQLPAVSSK